MIKCIAIDDEPLALRQIRNYVGRTPELELAATFSDALAAREYLRGEEVDLIFVDINMPDLNGMDFVKTLSAPPMVIFITAYPQYAVESYKVSAVDYLLKPYGFAEFTTAVNKAVALSASHTAPHSEPAESLFIKTDYRYVRISLSEIRFIKGYGEYLQIHIAGKTMPLVTLSSFAAIKERLTPNFLQVHRSYIINMDRVEQIERNRVIMDAENHIPVGDSYKAAFQQYLTTRAIGKTSK